MNITPKEILFPKVKSKTILEIKNREKANKYQKKKESKINVTKDNHDYIWNHLSQTLFSLDYASFHISALQRKQMFPDSDKIVEFAKLTELKFKSFLSHLPEDKKKEYTASRSEFEEFARQFSTFNEKERQRIYSMANKIEKEKYQ